MKLKNMLCCMALCARSPYIFVNSPYIRCDAFNLTKYKYLQNYRFIFFFCGQNIVTWKSRICALYFTSGHKHALKIHCHGIPIIGMWLNSYGVQWALKQRRHHNLILFCFQKNILHKSWFHMHYECCMLLCHGGWWGIDWWEDFVIVNPWASYLKILLWDLWDVWNLDYLNWFDSMLVSHTQSHPLNHPSTIIVSTWDLAQCLCLCGICYRRW
jgi:hypothetical protein